MWPHWQYKISFKNVLARELNLSSVALHSLSEPFINYLYHFFKAKMFIPLKGNSGCPKGLLPLQPSCHYQLRWSTGLTSKPSVSMNHLHTTTCEIGSRFETTRITLSETDKDQWTIHTYPPFQLPPRLHPKKYDIYTHAHTYTPRNPVKKTSAMCGSNKPHCFL